MSKHTPGPWSYEVHELSSGYSGIVYDANGWRVADHLTEADARLIAAAPLMLEALKRIRDQCGEDAHELWIWRTAQQAITAAEGGDG